MKIGLLVAIEMDSVFAYYPECEKRDAPCGFDLYYTRKDGNEICILHTGMGEIASAAGTQYLITGCGVDLIVNFGVVGGLTAGMKSCKVCVVDRVVHYKYDCSEFLPLQVGQVAEHDSVYLPTTADLVKRAVELHPDLARVTCCSGDKFVGTAEEKAAIHERFDGDVCDMESAGIVLTCEANGTPCLLLKAVADGLAGGAQEFFDELLGAGNLCLGVADAIIGQID